MNPEDLHLMVGEIGARTKAMSTDLAKMKKDLEILKEFRWMIMGITAGVSGLITAGFEILRLVKGV